MSTKYYCDFCSNQVDRWASIRVVVGTDPGIYEMACLDCVKKVTAFMEHLKTIDNFDPRKRGLY